MKEFWEEHFGQIFLGFLFVLMVVVEVHLVHHGDPDARNWGETLTSQILTGILGFTAGKIVGKNGNGNTEKKETTDVKANTP